MKVGIVDGGLKGELLMEITGISRALGAKFKRLDKNLYVSRYHDRFYQLAFAKVVGRYEFSFRREGEIPEKIVSLRRWVLKSPFAVRGVITEKVGWWLDGKVDLEHPKNVIYVHKGDKYHVLSHAKIIKGKDFSSRDARNRPFFHPSSMNARDARLLVNAAGVMRGDTVLDPFCGAGGILIEAGLIRAKVIGVDIREDMVEGCKRNLEYYRIRGDVYRGDALKVEEEVDIIVTDPPYGRSSTLRGRDLYYRFLKRAHNIVRKSLVIVLPFDGSALIEKSGFTIVKQLRRRVHSSLTRWVFLCSP